MVLGNYSELTGISCQMSDWQWHLLLMILVTLLPFVNGMLGEIYAVGVIILSVGFIVSAFPLARTRSKKGALLLLKSSVFYLPALLLLIIIDLEV